MMVTTVGTTGRRWLGRSCRSTSQQWQDCRCVLVVGRSAAGMPPPETCSYDTSNISNAMRVCHAPLQPERHTTLHPAIHTTFDT
mgnify:CR=1 FL=1